MRKSGNTIIIVAQFINKTEYPQHELYKLDLSSGESCKISAGFKGKDSYSFIVGLDFEDENTIVISSVVTTSMLNMVVKGYRFDLQKEKVIEDFILPYSIAYSYDAESKSLYYIESGLIKGYDTDSSGIMTLSKVDYPVQESLLNSKYTFDRVYYANDNIIVWNKITNKIIVADLASDIEPLKIMLSDTVSMYLNTASIIDQFETEYGCPVHIIEYPQDVYGEKLRIKLLATENDFDICMINDPTKDNLLSSILSHDLYEPLDSYDGIVKNFSQMYSGVRSMMSHEGKLFGVPYYMILFSTSMGIEYDFTQYGYTTPDKHWTNNDLWGLCDEIINSGVQNVSVFSDPNELIGFLDIFVQEAISQNHLDKAALIKLLENIKKYSDAGAFVNLSTLDNPSGANKYLFGRTATYFGSFIMHDTIPDYPKYGTVLYPAYSNKVYHYLNGFSFINKFSNNKEMAAKFIEVMTRSKNIYNTHIYPTTLIGSDITKYDIYNQWSTTELSYLADLPALFENSGVYTYDYLSLNDYLRENVMIGFYDGSISVKEAAEMIYDQVSYTYFE